MPDEYEHLLNFSVKKFALLDNAFKSLKQIAAPEHESFAKVAEQAKVAVAGLEKTGKEFQLS